MNLNEPIEIAPRVWWVGHVIEGDPFQCHVYLIANGSSSILIDPGSKLTWPSTREKIKKILPLEDIRYIVVHHQDPDIVSCLEDFFQEVGVKDRYVVTHWRTKALLKHYDWGVEFYEVDKNSWQLKVGEVELDFIFTPYMHFPGSICSYYKKEKILFSSDIFGAFTPEFSLWAKGAKEYFEYMKPFHTHYMPSREIVNFGLDEIEKYDIEFIAPQHGSIIKKEFISYIIGALRKLDVGLFLEFLGSHNIQKLTKAHEIVSKAYESVIYATESMYKKAGVVLSLFNELFAIDRIVCVTSMGDSTIFFDSLYTLPKERKSKDEFIKEFDVEEITKEPFLKTDTLFGYRLDRDYFIFRSIVYNENHQAIGVCHILFSDYEILEDDDINILKSFHKILSLMLLKEINIYELEKEKKELMYKAITDPLTGLNNRSYFEDIFDKEIDKALRHNYPLSVAMIDLDDFKKINDAFGHDVGDIVLRDFAKILKNSLRQEDIIFRYGGEEFVILFPFCNAKDAQEILNKILLKLNQKAISIGSQKISYHFSAGISSLEKGIKSAYMLIKEADNALYEAKKRKNMVVIANA